MVGALARLGLHGDHLDAGGRKAAAALGLALPSEDPLGNNAAQAVELVHDLEASRAIVDELLARGLHADPPAPVRPRAGTGTAVAEAPRGLLLHRYRFNAYGTVTDAEVITPTALNAASIEERFRAVVGREPGAADAVLRPRLERVARAYDPCISCSVHVVRAGAARRR
jgi:sulfhydrogenase subunit alpha